MAQERVHFARLRSLFAATMTATLGLACTADLVGDPSGATSGAEGSSRGDGDGPNGSSDLDGPNAPVNCAAPPAEVGAPVPMRRLTSAQLTATVEDVLDYETHFAIADETLYGFKSNTTVSVDSTVARTLLDVSEEIAVALIPGVVADPRCSEQCGQFVLEQIAPALFRRPLDEETLARYLVLYEKGLETGGREEALTWLLSGLLQSPRFIYQLETTDEEGRLDAHSLASRLSFALWGGPPDSELLASAEAGELTTADDVEAAADRLIDDPRLVRGLAQFTGYWLKLEALENVSERPDIAGLEPAHRNALMNEPVEFLAGLIRGGAPVAELFQSTTIPASPALYDTYGDDIVSVDGETAQLDPSRRAGLFGLAGTMAALAHAGQTAPTLRGLTVLGNVLCDPPPPPPVGVVTVLPPAAPDATLRQRLELHFEEPACAGCHTAMDGIGFAFEGFDWLGQARDSDNGQPVDTSAEFTIGGEAVSVQGPTDMADVLAERTEASECFARQFTRFAVGIPEGRQVECQVQDMGETAQGEGGLRSMVLELVTSPWFVQLGETEEAL